MFQILPLKREYFAPFFELDDKELSARNMQRVKADAKPGYPCRISLDFADIGENVILLNYTHHQVNSPFESKYAIYVRENTEEIRLNAGELPPVFLRESPIALRGFNAEGFLKRAQIENGPKLAPLIEGFFEDARIDYIHAHYAAYGCYGAKIVRA